MEKHNKYASKFIFGLACLTSFSCLGNTNASQVNAGGDVIAPKAKWNLLDENDIGFDSATLDGTNKYHLTNYNGVTISDGAAVFKDSILYAEKAENDPTYQELKVDDCTLCFSISIPEQTWPKNAVPVNIRWSSATCFCGFYIKANTHDLYYANSDNGDTDYFSSGKILTLEPNRRYDFVMSVSIYDTTKIYVDGEPEPIYVGESFLDSLSSKWTALSFGGVVRCRNGNHNVDIFESFCNGMKLYDAAAYGFAFTPELAAEYHKTYRVTGEIPEQYFPPFIHDPSPDFELIKNSKLKSRTFMISDSHYRGDGTNPYGDSLVAQCFEDMNSLGLESDGVLALGDLSDTGCDRSRTTLPNWYNFLDTKPAKNPDGTPIEVYGILGNHDVRGDSEKKHTDYERYEDFLVTAKLYQEKEPYNKWGKDKTGKGSYSENQKFPDLSYVREINGYHYVFLNTSEPKWDECCLTLDAVNWVDNTLTELEETDGNKPIFLLLHQPIDHGEIFVIDENGKRLTDEYFFHRMISKHLTTVICTGHTHNALGPNHRFQGVYYNGIKIPNYINLPSLEWNRYSDYTPNGVKGYLPVESINPSEVQYYVVEIYENGLIFRARDGFYKTWRTDADMGILFNGKVKFVDADGTLITENTYKCGDEIIVPNDPDTSSLEYTEFKGWSPKLDTICHGDVTYKAVYITRPADAPATYTIKFENNGHGAKPNDLIVKYGFSIGKIDNLVEPGYVFEGWFTNKSCTKTIDFEETAITSDLVLYAKWSCGSGTPYKVEHYLENANDNGYTLALTQEFSGVTEGITEAAKSGLFSDYKVKDFEQETIKGDGSTTVKIYYDRERYSVSVSNDVSKGNCEVSCLTPKFGENIVLTLTCKENYAIDTVKINNEIVEVVENKVNYNNVYSDVDIVITYKKVGGEEKKESFFQKFFRKIGEFFKKLFKRK